MEKNELLLIPKVLAFFINTLTLLFSFSIYFLTDKNAVLFILISIVLMLLTLYASFAPKPGGLILQLGSTGLFVGMIFLAIHLNSPGWLFYILLVFAIFVFIGHLFDHYAT